ncbi:hypothetical protein ACFLYH_00310 [Candidatus Dependentiae bacterium]
MYQGTIDRHLALEMLSLYDPEYRQYLKLSKLKDETVGETKFMAIMIPQYRTVPLSEFTKTRACGKTEEELKKRLDIVHELITFPLTEEEMDEMKQLAAKIAARRKSVRTPGDCSHSEEEYQDAIRSTRGSCDIKQVQM